MNTTTTTRRTVIKDGPDPIDIAVGQRVRSRRIARGMSQTDLGDAIGLTFQQVQKYERGANRISASKLWKIAKVLETPITWFFGTVEGAHDPESDGTYDRKTLEAARHFSAIPNENMRDAAFVMIKSMSNGAASVPSAAE